MSHTWGKINEPAPQKPAPPPIVCIREGIDSPMKSEHHNGRPFDQQHFEPKPFDENDYPKLAAEDNPAMDSIVMSLRWLVGIGLVVVGLLGWIVIRN